MLFGWYVCVCVCCVCCVFFFQAEDGIRDLVRSLGLGDVYKRQGKRGQVAPFCCQSSSVDGSNRSCSARCVFGRAYSPFRALHRDRHYNREHHYRCLLYTSDAADERSSVDLGGRRIIKKKKNAPRGAQIPVRHMITTIK